MRSVAFHVKERTLQISLLANLGSLTPESVKMTSSDILVLKLISVLVFVLFSSQNCYFI